MELPLAFVQVNVQVKLLGPGKSPVGWLPLVGLLPNQAPDASQDVAFVELQLNVDDFPESTDMGLADIVTVGGGNTARSSQEFFDSFFQQQQNKFHIYLLHLLKQYHCYI